MQSSSARGVKMRVAFFFTKDYYIQDMQSSSARGVKVRVVFLFFNQGQYTRHAEQSPHSAYAREKKTLNLSAASLYIVILF